MAKYYDDFRGVDNLVFALVTKDDAEGYTTGEVQDLIPVAEISKSTEASSASKYYDNIPAIVINSEGADEISITGAAIPLDVLAAITGKQIDATSGAYIDGPAVPPYVAIGYMYGLTDGSTVVYWRLKGKFTLPEATSATEDDGTDSNGQELTFTGVNTNHKFSTNGNTAKGVVIDSRISNFDVENVFAQVCTPDNLATVGVTRKTATNNG
jgi:phi13 family phage major tail protein